MGYYEQKKRELEDLLSLVEKEKAILQTSVATEEENINNEKQILEKKIIHCKKLKEGVIQLAKERQIGFPWLAKAYDEYFQLQDNTIINYLKDKKRPAYSAAEVVREQSQLRRNAEKEKKIAQYLVEYYENIAPFLVDLREEIFDTTHDSLDSIKDYSEEELSDGATQYLTKEEYRNLSSKERNQLALDRFWKRPKSKWFLGRIYERYIGYLYEADDYDVEYEGIFKGKEDLGRDLICQKGKDCIIVQCKNWSQFKTIYEKHIFQFFGTVFEYKYAHPKQKVKAVFYTTTKLSDLARHFANELNIELQESFKFDNSYPSIKCNISRINKTKIYHLPFDQQYDSVKIEKSRGEFYCSYVEEAEQAGFRRAFKYNLKNRV